MSSIFSTSACGVGTHTTSLPSCPTVGWYSVLAGAFWAGSFAAEDLASFAGADFVSFAGWASAKLSATIAARPDVARIRGRDWNLILSSDECAQVGYIRLGPFLNAQLGQARVGCGSGAGCLAGG